MALGAPYRRRLRRVFVVFAGGAGLVSGAVLLALPGPGLLVILASLALLASEFPWAQRLLARARWRFARLRAQTRRRQRRLARGDREPAAPSDRPAAPSKRVRDDDQ